MADFTAQTKTRTTLRHQLHRLTDWQRVALLGRESRCHKRERRALNTISKTAFTPSDQLEPRLVRH